MDIANSSITWHDDKTLLNLISYVAKDNAESANGAPQAARTRWHSPACVALD